MDYNEVLQTARTKIGTKCKACPVCNGVACRNTMPGPGAKGVGDTAIRNYQKWQEIRVNMDTLCEKSRSIPVWSCLASSFAILFLQVPSERWQCITAMFIVT